jgi:addiction module RelE/StbE family toxin
VTGRRVIFSPQFLRRLEDIRERVGLDNPVAAARVIERIRTAVRRLAASPAIGRLGRVEGMRELVITGTPYIVPYRVKDDTVEIVTVLHSAQGWPERFS